MIVAIQLILPVSPIVRIILVQLQACSKGSLKGNHNQPKRRRSEFFFEICVPWFADCFAETKLEMHYLDVGIHTDKASGWVVDSWTDFEDFDVSLFGWFSKVIDLGWPIWLAGALEEIGDEISLLGISGSQNHNSRQYLWKKGRMTMTTWQHWNTCTWSVPLSALRDCLLYTSPSPRDA